jgi:hypothetical protein
MEELIRNFESVLNRLMLPKFPYITEIEILAGMITGDESEDYQTVFRVQVDYTIKDDIKNREQREIEQETISLFRMMGFSESASLRIFFTKVTG